MQKKYFYDNPDFEFTITREISGFTLPEPFHRTIKPEMTGNDVWRAKYLLSRYLFYRGFGTPFPIDQKACSNFFDALIEFKKEEDIKEKHCGFETLKKLTKYAENSYYFFLKITLPDDRSKLGNLHLYDGEGNEIYSCLARGHGQHDSKTEESQKIENGDTPIGIYLSSYESGILKNTPEKFGPAGLFRLWQPLYGYALGIYKVNRDGILVHGGTKAKELRRSHGCVIIHDTDQIEIQKKMIELNHPFLLPSHYVQFYTGIVFVERMI
ncbi:L,D-transpeptidase [Kosmotoga sp. DU53]|uniref:L,D-transpeptidase n=1 Tax=Kosmotoga sp. DU53 TaxID=1310160 RepID=UPI0007C53F2F|nr:L,D-transpeptidase [Kosmotoga sp. DU53]OAA22139.1 hypothetical protein DU53_04655 [Kosmotoga sp. DU53]